MFFRLPHVIYRNGHPYFMLRVPADLLSKFGFRFIRKAIKSKNPADIKLLVLGYPCQREKANQPV